MIGSAAVLAEAALPRSARANVPVPYSFDLQPPTTGKEAFIKWAVENRGENPKTLAARWDRYVFLRANNDFVNARNGRAFLLTPRDEFVLKRDIVRAYERDFHDIGWGVTISGPLVVSRMTSTIDVQMGEKVLEIGTGSGNQSAYLSNLTDKVWTIEIIKPLAERTRGIYDDLIARGYTEYKAISSKAADVKEIAARRQAPARKRVSIATPRVMDRLYGPFVMGWSGTQRSVSNKVRLTACRRYGCP